VNLLAKIAKILVLCATVLLVGGWGNQNGVIEGGGVSPYPTTKSVYLYSGSGFKASSVDNWLDTAICGSVFSPTASLYLAFQYTMPFDYSVGTNIDVYIDWSPVTTNVGNVVWKFLYDVTVSGGTMHRVTIGGFTTVTTTLATDGTAYKVQYDKLATIVGPAANTGLLSVVIERAGADLADTFTGNAKVYGVELVYTAAQYGAAARP